MNIYFLQMQRRKTKSNLKLHIEANDQSDAQTFAHRQLNTANETNWICWNVIKVKCPSYPYEEYKGHKIWFDDIQFIILQPGESRCIRQYLKNVRLDDIKTYIDNEVISV